MKIHYLIQKPKNHKAKIFTDEYSNHLIKLGQQVKIIKIDSRTLALLHINIYKDLREVLQKIYLT